MLFLLKCTWLECIIHYRFWILCIRQRCLWSDLCFLRWLCRCHLVLVHRCSLVQLLIWHVGQQNHVDASQSQPLLLLDSYPCRSLRTPSCPCWYVIVLRQTQRLLYSFCCHRYLRVQRQRRSKGLLIHHLRSWFWHRRGPGRSGPAALESARGLHSRCWMMIYYQHVRHPPLP